LKKHKAECPKKPADNQPPKEPETAPSEPQGAPAGQPITLDLRVQSTHKVDGHTIPLEKCPSELRFLAEGKTVGLKVQGTLTADGVVIEKVDLVR
jgi:hypothetical protein